MVMNTKTLTYLLEHPDHITAVQTSDMRAVIDEFPYFQSAQAIYLKGLKNQESFTYNSALKRTAAATADRSVLFDYITSEVFNQNDISEQIKVQEQTLRGLTIQDLQDVSNQVQTEELAKASQILDPGLFVEKKDSEMTAERPEEILQLGKPLNFNTNETHSFGEWLRFAAFKPIDRSKTETTEAQLSETVAEETEEKIESLAISSNEVTQKSVLSKVEVRKRKQQIIDSFIETNPKINVTPKASLQKKSIIQEPLIPSDVLMTETLARVYIEQNNFKKAKQAYRILSLKYPEKSGFFADQIRAIEQLEEK
tara:strand:+ start:23649 stop:24581 length:933 start_codon:yes stop_codon:yes gene_type:complete